jgi:hypothetical protein
MGNPNRSMECKESELGRKDTISRIGTATITRRHIFALDLNKIVFFGGDGGFALTDMLSFSPWMQLLYTHI